ncbi:ATP-binding cassette domain-containing protein [Acidithiobacillus sp.]
MSDATLVLEDVHKGFRQRGTTVQALQGVSLRVQAGRITGLLGPDGAGKTTLIRLAAALLLPDAGRILVLGEDTRRAAARIQENIGYMPQRFGLYEDLTVQENLDLYGDLQGLSAADKTARHEDLLRLTALGPFGRRRAGDLSGGMKQKLGLTCALLRAPRVLLLDEPTVGVDPISRRELWSIIRGLREKGTSILISTAYLDEAERCDDVLLFHEGKLLAHESPADFHAPMTGRCYLVQHAALTRRQLQARLAQRPGVVDATIQAAGVRVVCQESAALSEDGEHWQNVPPRFEDAFVTLLRSGSPATPTPTGDPPEAMAGAQDPDGDSIIEVRELRRFFGHFEAVRGISFTVKAGEIFGLLGANGAGKTTTFRMLCGLLPASSGTLRVAGADLLRSGAAARARIGYVSQKFSLYGNLSVTQNLRFFASTYGLRGSQWRRRIDWAMTEFDLAAYTDVNSDDLPLGFKQRLALACALMHEPPILFLDEPTSGVDPLARREFWSRINTLAEGGVTVMITTHFMDEAEYCDHLVLMSLGEILALGSPQEIRAQARRPDLPNPTMEDAFVELIQSHEAGVRSTS